eukprot:TRINITY_DN12454_c0_g1_i2.p1 TRINITY_DN12454_c0_g1~~TRINITY_DN12454_c0_g1_i2.p1  ORF type:complete len:271 (+),score=44.94 TRINITY_DN12454_c0_g1_i2:388-1200(+)
MMKQNLFLMEAFWTRYFPLSCYVRELVSSGRLGAIQRVYADNSINFKPESNMADGKHRIVNPDLAGGGLLDLGVYSLTWVFQTLYTTLPREERKRPTVLSSVKIYQPTGCDELVTMLLTFPRDYSKGGDVHAVASCGIKYSTDPKKDRSSGPACRIQGQDGEIQVFSPLYRPTKTRLILSDGTIEDKEWPQPGPGKGSGWFNGDLDEGEGHGMFWEADEVANALIEGRKEGQFEDLEESVLIMEVMDEVRRQGGLVYPEKIESTNYPVTL